MVTVPVWASAVNGETARQTTANVKLKIFITNFDKNMNLQTASTGGLQSGIIPCLQSPGTLRHGFADPPTKRSTFLQKTAAWSESFQIHAAVGCDSFGPPIIWPTDRTYYRSWAQ